MRQDFVNFNVTQPLIGYTVSFSQSEIALHSTQENKAKNFLNNGW